MRILSIDFDYFINTDIDTRNVCFPNGHDDLPPSLIRFVWDRRYEFHDNIRNLGVIKDFDVMCEFLRNSNCDHILIADSHREISKLFDNIKEDEELELINIDFHHDMYVTGGENLDCGNWLRFLVDIKPNAKITWVRREDSDVDSLMGDFPYHHTTDISEVQGEFDAIFICFSSPWTPPHLYDKFLEMIAVF